MDLKTHGIANFKKPTTTPKYFGIDVDKTFYTQNHDIFKRNVDAFKLLKTKNITPFFCTGKGFDSNKKVITTDFVNQTGYNGYPGVYNNGALVYDPDGNIIKMEKLSVELLDKFKDYATTNCINDKTIYYTDEKPYRLDELTQETKAYYGQFNLGDIEKITYDELKQKNVLSTSTYGHELYDFPLINDVDYIKFVQPAANELIQKGISKKTGIETLLKHLNSNGNECVYIGDSANDNQAMEYCYVSFAVGNAEQDTKKKAKWALDLNYDQGAFEKAVKLLVEDQTVFRKNINAFKLLKDKNITPFFCTGRGYQSNKKVLTTYFQSTTGYNGYPGVYNNGAVVYDENGNSIKIEKFSVDILDRFNDYASTNSINDRTIYFTEDKMYRVQDLTNDTLDYLKQFNLENTEQISYDDLKLKNVVSINSYGHELDNFESINDVHYVKFRQPGGNILSPKAVNKKTGIEALLNHFNSSGNECVYIGDSVNDHEAMEYCYMSFAVGNADEDTKKKATWVLDLNFDQAAFEKAVKLLVDDQDTPPKYFGIDVDGTFYVEDENVYNKNIDAFKLLKDKNIKPFLCTGRGYQSNKKVLTTYFQSTTGYNGYPGVYNNGAVVYDENGNSIKIEKFTESFVTSFKDYATTNNINDRVIYYTDQKIHCLDTLTNDAVTYFNSLRYDDIELITFDELKQKNVLTIGCHNRNLDDFPSINEVYYVKFGQGEYFQLGPKGVNKKVGLETLLNYYQSNANECAFIGDSPNDHEAMEYCYVSFAVGNADDETKKKATWVLDLNFDQAAFEKAVKLLVDDQE
ncbi:hypothetical protein MACJ_000863 [Theileria orientalis]|uniref:Hydrolase n=1 Tax=Theileria orientalis TaxID=68886 RepID=A0A976M4R5_THEOR|nr:hypothetical protein MACJ_000863 [Theileria orientalis]